jgi:arginine decarboxylase
MIRPHNSVPLVSGPDRSAVGSRNAHDRLLIRVSKGSGAGPTHLAAFDLALFTAGIAGYNIIRLSSVIPPHSVVRDVSAAEQIQGTEGDVAYCVYAAAYASEPGKQAWAGVAWATGRDPSRAGVFVEHAGHSESVVRRDLDATIGAMAAIRNGQYSMAGQSVSSAVCLDQPVCAVVVATFGTASWTDLLSSEG